ncbi:MAG: hypothetical protein A2X62_16835, partial [Stygiobacter sp. GWC2_38_9]
MIGMRNQTILLVDKKTLYVKEAIRVLRGAGFTTVHASTCDQALKETQKQDRKINLILLDINLCNGVNETQAVQKILNEYDIPLMLLISDLDNEAIINSNHITSYGYINKNSSEAILIASIKSTLKLHSEILQNKLLFNSAADGIHILDTEGNVVQVTDSFCKMLGYTAEEMSKLNVAQWEANRTQDELKEILKHQTKIVKIFNTKHRHRDGHLIDVEISMIKVALESQTVFFASARDITKRLQIEKSLKESEEKYKRLVDFAPTPIMVHQDGRFVAVNQETIELFGAKNESELLGTLVIDRVHPDFVNTVKKRINDITIEGKRAPVLEEKLFRLDGTIIDAEVSAVPISYKGRSAVQIVIRDITEQNKAKRLLKESEERHRTFLENLSDIAYELDVNGNLTFVNKAAELITGEKVSEWMGKSFMPLLTEESRQVAFLGVQRVLSTGHSESEVNLINGKVLLFRSELKTDDSGKVIGILGLNSKKKNLDFNADEISLLNMLGQIIVNAIQRKKTELSLRESEERLELALKGADLGLWDWEVQTKKITYNENWAKILGYRLSELKPQFETWQKLVHNEDYKRVRTALNNHLKGKTLFYETEYRMLTKSGKWKWILDKGRVIERDKNGKALRAAGTTLDITDKKNFEEALIRSEERFRSLFENSAFGIYQTSVNGKIELCNNAFLEIFGYQSLDEIKDKEISKNFYLAPSDREKFLSELFKKGKINGHEVEYKNAKGKKVYVREYARIVFVNGRNLIEGAVEDITKNKSAEFELLKAKEKAEESDKLKSEFLAQMSHEIRTPINTVLSFAGLLKDELTGKLAKDLEDSFGVMNRAGRRIIRTIDLLLDMSQMQTGTYEVNLKKIDVCEKILKEMADEYKYTAKEKKLIFEIIKQDDENFVIGDEYTIGQILHNLIDNAIKYTNKGSVQVIVAKEKNKYVTVKIADTGIGISAEYLPNIFKPFTQEDQGYTRKYE